MNKKQIAPFILYSKTTANSDYAVLITRGQAECNYCNSTTAGGLSALVYFTMTKMRYKGTVKLTS